MKQVDIILLQGSPDLFSWPLGRVTAVPATPVALADFAFKQLNQESADYWLFWNTHLGVPNTELIYSLLSTNVDVWHAGLALGMKGLPEAIDYVSPVWMLNRDASPDSESTSWRVSLHACLVKTEVLRQVGFVHPEFATLEGAALEWGYRCIRRGVLMRFSPALVNASPSISTRELPFDDEMRFITHSFGRKWAMWALGRALSTGYRSPREVFQTWKKYASYDAPPVPSPYKQLLSEDPSSMNCNENAFAKVSVLIPTLDRYPYLRTLLCQLRNQTMPPLEVIVVDQTCQNNGEDMSYEEFSDLPLRVIFQNEAGQCSSRNRGLQVAQGEYILFLDDDDEIPANLIESHLNNLFRFGVDVSSGVVDEVGTGPLHEQFSFYRSSDVFPTNNTLICKAVLKRSGLFDLAYEHGERADGDLGMRVYLSGALMVLDPTIRVLHHHAPRGGLRTHKARVVTYASSRRKLTHRQIPSATEIYLARRYFSTEQVREAILLRVLGTFSSHGNRLQKVMKLLFSFLLLPDTLRQVQKNNHRSKRMIRLFPQFPQL